MAAPCLAVRLPPRAASASMPCSTAATSESDPNACVDQFLVNCHKRPCDPSLANQCNDANAIAWRQLRLTVGHARSSKRDSHEQAASAKLTLSHAFLPRAQYHWTSRVLMIPMTSRLQGPSNTADQLRSGAPARLAGGGTGRHLSLPFGCRPGLRQLHPLVGRPAQSTSSAMDLTSTSAPALSSSALVP
jgi:hypothetical protein